MAFMVTRFFTPLVTALGQDWTFWIFSMFCAAVVLFAVFFIPETKGKTLEDIQVDDQRPSNYVGQAAVFTRG